MKAGKTGPATQDGLQAREVVARAREREKRRKVGPAEENWNQI
jgi:hypothetical protein